ncbi:TonB-dependent receptor [Oecophyllibacter saccharovorans]|nr:TonB-dependent receptor [Oecophyllibacter saccharovorans]
MPPAPVFQPVPTGFPQGTQPQRTRKDRHLPAALVLVGLWLVTATVVRAAPATLAPAANTPVERINVTARRHDAAPFTQSAETTSLFRDVPGFSAWNTGGTTDLPVLNGMAADRVASFVDGMRLGADCPNEMNPALSLVSPDLMARSSATAGITSVSMGGDSTGGTVSVSRRPPQFARRKDSVLVTGDGRGDWGSNGGRSGASGAFTVATDQLSLRYSGAYAHATDYTAGGSRAPGKGGGRVASTSYLTFNQAVTAGLRHGNHLFDFTFSQQDVPYEAFPNQYMDETNNRTTVVNGHYAGNFDWGVLEARGFWERVIHAMNMLGDKGGHGPAPMGASMGMRAMAGMMPMRAERGMPMNSDGREAGYDLRATVTLSATQGVCLGSAFEHHGLNDWWPAVPGSMMMGPGTWHEINHGRRDHLGNFVQWNAQWSPRFSTEAGIRSDLIMMNTGRVSPYSWNAMGMNGASADIMAARAFNAARRRRTDSNFDATLLARWEATPFLHLEGGWARKTRSPNFYERYAWGVSSMASRMIGWFGDGNGYVGTLNLKPEVANTFSFTLRFHDPLSSSRRWEMEVQPFFTATHNYIDVNRTARLGPGIYRLKFANHRAQSYGLNARGQALLWHSPLMGEGRLSAVLSWVRGQDLTMHSGLYQQMPLNGRLRFEESRGPWSAHAEVILVKAKKTVDWVRDEPRTPGYALLGLGASYRWHAGRPSTEPPTLQLDVSLENLLNQRYYLPLGGRDLSGGMGNTMNQDGPPPVLAMGRSLNLTLRGYF